MPRFSFSTAQRAQSNTVPTSNVGAVPTLQGLPAEVTTLIGVVFVEAFLLVGLRHYFRHYHGG